MPLLKSRVTRKIVRMTLTERTSLMRCILIPIAIVTCLSARPSTCFTLLDGNFLDPDTWDCGCDPLQCDTLHVSHALQLGSNVDLFASLFIGDQGSITGPWDLSCHGAFFNTGTIDVGSLTTFHPCSFYNEGNIGCTGLTGIVASFSNNGTVNVNDSMYIHSTTAPINDGALDSHVLGLVPQLWNNGDITCDRLYFGVLMNEGSINCSSLGWPQNPVHNYGYLYADTLEIQQILEIGGSGRVDCPTLILTGELENFGTLRVFGTAYLGEGGGPGDLQMHEGSTTETQNLINADGSYLRGPGTLCIAGHSENHGVVSGPITICDITPESSSPPYMDEHDGAVLLPVYPCATNACPTVGVAEGPEKDCFEFYPVPASGAFTLMLGAGAAALQELRLLDPMGKLTISIAGPFGQQVRVEPPASASGVWFLEGIGLDGRRALSERVMLAP